MKARVDVGKIAKGLRARRRARVSAGAGIFGAMQVAADVQARFKVPRGGGRATDPSWTERRLVPLAPPTLRRLEQLAEHLGKTRRVNLTPMQMAALLLERTVEHLGEADVDELTRDLAVNP